MKGGEHAAIGAVSAMAALGLLAGVGLPINTATVGLAGVVSAAGALLPDLDHPSSKASRGLPIRLLTEGLGAILFVGAIVYYFSTLGLDVMGTASGEGLGTYIRFGVLAIVGAVVLFGASAAVRSFSPHRGVTHSMGFVALTTVLAVLASLIGGASGWYGLLVGWGCLTHIVSDATTPKGTPYFWWPFKGLVKAWQSVPAPQRERTIPTAQGVSARPTIPPAIHSTSPSTQTVPLRTVGAAAPLCPHCGVPMVVRVAKRGARSGRRFYGCPNYPRCRQTRELA